MQRLGQESRDQSEQHDDANFSSRRIGPSTRVAARDGRRRCPAYFRPIQHECRRQRSASSTKCNGSAATNQPAKLNSARMEGGSNPCTSRPTDEPVRNNPAICPKPTNEASAPIRSRRARPPVAQRFHDFAHHRRRQRRAARGIGKRRCHRGPHQRQRYAAAREARGFAAKRQQGDAIEGPELPPLRQPQAR